MYTDWAATVDSAPAASKQQITLFIVVVLKIEAQIQLELTGCSRPDRGCVVRRSDQPEGRARFGIGPLDVRLSDLCPIQQIEYICSKTDSHTLRQAEPLVQGSIDLPDSRCPKDIAACVTPCA